MTRNQRQLIGLVVVFWIMCEFIADHTEFFSAGVELLLLKLQQLK